MPISSMPGFFLKNCIYALDDDDSGDLAVATAKTRLFLDIAALLGAEPLISHLGKLRIRVRLSADVPDSRRMADQKALMGHTFFAPEDVDGWQTIGHFDEKTRTVTLNIRFSADELASALDRMAQNIARTCRFGTSPILGPLVITRHDLTPARR